MRLRLSTGVWLRSLLLSTALLDELTDGFLVVGIPPARDSFAMTYEQVGRYSPSAQSQRWWSSGQTPQLAHSPVGHCFQAWVIYYPRWW